MPEREYSFCGEEKDAVRRMYFVRPPLFEGEEVYCCKPCTPENVRKWLRREDPPLCETCGEVEAEVSIRDGAVTTRFCRSCAPGPLLEGLSRIGGNVLTLAPR